MNCFYAKSYYELSNSKQAFEGLHYDTNSDLWRMRLILIWYGSSRLVKLYSRSCAGGVVSLSMGSTSAGGVVSLSMGSPSSTTLLSCKVGGGLE